ncbi:hypothetical protein [Streptomyces sp. NWU339]|uniref:hypothetical protein n=1 Tax=Streptomyces sp. NWU339 TaxID=2185284 RepID=UPI0015E81E3F|nr:hypothetical protein [Streptomyces sp. NWU339]
MTSVDLADRRELLDRLEQYYDAVPRSGARVEDFGPLTLFIREGVLLEKSSAPVKRCSGTR